MDILIKASERLSKDFASLNDEWEALFSLPQSDAERLELLKWVFSESPAYWATRVKAGQLLLQQDPKGTWETIEALVESSDPDDNGTALMLFEQLEDPRGLELARFWLTDETHISTQFDAMVYLKETYPEQVRQRLKILIQNENQDVRQRTQELLNELDTA